MKKSILVLFSCLMVSCRSAGSFLPAAADRSFVIQESRDSLERGEFFRARQLAGKILQEDPGDFEAQKLMAEILDREIAGQREVLGSKFVEDYSDAERTAEARTWLERAESLLSLGEYEQAVLAAEKVFQYEPGNIRASALMDRIRREAQAEGKAESIWLKKMYAGESTERVNLYLGQARDWIREGRTGAARLAVEKALLLQPENREALKLYGTLESQRKADPT